MRQGGDENDAFAICQGRCREATDDPIQKVLVLIEMDDVILRGGVSQKVIPSLRMARQIRGSVRVRVCSFHQPSQMIFIGPKRLNMRARRRVVGASWNGMSCLPAAIAVPVWVVRVWVPCLSL